jgi:hemin uptake protein HemP
MKINKGIAVGLAVSVVLVSVVSAQYVLQPSGRIFQAGAPMFPAQAFAPHPSNIVNLDSGTPPGQHQNGSSEISVLGSESVSIYQVPSNKYFVLTHWRARVGGGATTLSLVEERLGQLTSKINTVDINAPSTAAYTSDDSSRVFSPLGLVFRPNSSVTIQNHSGSNYTLRYNAVGYLIDE